jgi:hypothetical protein
MKKKLVVSFSSGESSAFMAQWLKANKPDEYDMIFVMANTGEENEESLVFADRCDRHFGLGLIWVEADVNYGVRKSSSARVVNFETASRNGEPFEAIIQKYGIPNQMFPHCTRELKTSVIKAYLRSIGWRKYYTAIGYRSDEVDRANPKWKELRHIYPLISMVPMTKIDINRFWRDMPFRVKLKQYEDNCKVCWKKTLRKLLTLAKNNPERFDNFKRWEERYENFTPPTRKKNNPPYRFNRKNLSVTEILELSKEPFEEYHDERTVYAYKDDKLNNLDLDIGGGRCNDEHCEPF